MNKPVYLYISSCCSVAAKKDPCLRSESDRKERKFSQSSLGKWYCPKCAKKCTVKVTKAE